MKVTIEKALVTDVFTSEKTGTQFATVQTENGTFKLSSRKGGFDLNQLPRIEPMRMRATLHGRVFHKGGQALEVVDLAVDLLEGKKAA
ncbi:MAG: hypothetical protein KIT07_02120 [Anaerolineales bacterium]|nr:hypothetical protein [Anaerolineales bacterium]